MLKPGCEIPGCRDGARTHILKRKLEKPWIHYSSSRIRTMMMQFFPRTLVFNLKFLLLLCGYFIISSNSINRDLVRSDGYRSLAVKNIPSSEYNALYDLYESTDGPHWSWTNLSTSIPWNFSHNANPCSQKWQGVTCVCTASICHVTQLSLIKHNLSGPLVGTIGMLTHLTTLDLSNNNLTGKIPSSIGNFTQLQTFSLKLNQLTGQIPNTIQAMRVLQDIYLFSNLFNGTIPSCIYNLSRLQVLDFGDNFFSGTISPHVGNLTNLKILSLSVNQLVGTLTPFLGNLTKLNYLTMKYNNLHGSLPPSLGNLVNLIELSLSENRLSKTIPQELGKLVSLKTLNLDTNQLTGRIPSEFGNLISITELFLNDNRLVGSLPESLANVNTKDISTFSVGINLLTGNLPSSFAIWNVDIFDCARNSFSGKINSTIFENYNTINIFQFNDNFFEGDVVNLLENAEELFSFNAGNNLLTGHLAKQQSWIGLSYYLTYSNYFVGPVDQSFNEYQKMFYLELSHNYLTSTLPSWLSSLQVLTYVNLSFNCFTGSLNYSLGEISPYTQLSQLAISYNFMTGTLPASLGRAVGLVDLILNNNEFSGTIPQAYRDLINLQVLFLQNNLLTGQLYESVKIISLINLDVSNNQLTGSLPAFYVLNPSLKTFAASSNCLTGSIPDDLCLLSSFEFLSLNGLSTAVNCRKTIFPGSKILNAFYVNYYLVNGIPECLFSMPNLQTLHLSGNGLTGSFPSNLYNLSTSLMDLSLSHNLLTGTIPSSVQERSWNNLDLSYNKLTGTLAGNIHVFNDSATLSLEINRLSGDIPTVLLSTENIKILQGNIFACNINRNNLPKNDEDSVDYSCGSDVVNVAIYIWIGVSVLFVCIMYFIYLRITSLAKAYIRESQFSTVSTINNPINSAEKGEMVNNIRTSSDPSPAHDPNRETHLSTNNSLGRISRAISISSLERSRSASMASTERSVSSMRITYFDNFIDKVQQWRNKILFFEDDNENTVLMLKSIELFLSQIRKLAIRLTLVTFCLLLPTYVLLSFFYFTHKYSYAWNVSAVLISGVVPGIILIILFFVMIFIVLLFYDLLIEKETRLLEENYRISYRFRKILRKTKLLEYDAKWSSFVVLFIVGVINFFLMMIADVAYVIIILSYPTAVVVLTEIFLAVFKLALNNMIIWELIPLTRYYLDRYCFERVRQILKDDPEEISNGKVLSNIELNTFANKNVPSNSDDIENESQRSSRSQSLDSSLSSQSTNNSSSSSILSAVINSEEGKVGYSYSQKEVSFIMITVLFNNIIFPILAIFIVSPDCFYYSLFAAPAIDSSYSYTVCDKFSIVLDLCYTDVTLSEVSSYQPPFIYVYECASALIINYTSVFIIMYTYEGFLSPLLKIMLKVLTDRLFFDFAQTQKKNKDEGNGNNNFTSAKKRSSLRNLLQKSSLQYRFLVSILPDNLKELTPEKPKDRKVNLFDKNRLAVKLNSALVIMMSFGTLFPPLALMICTTIITVTYYEETVLGRLLYESEKLGYTWYKKQLEKDCYGIADSLKYTLWSLVPVSSILYAYIIFDTWGDQTGWKSALAPTILMAVIPIIVLIIVKKYEGITSIFSRWIELCRSVGKSEKKHEREDEELSGNVSESSNDESKTHVQLPETLVIVEMPERTSHVTTVKKPEKGEEKKEEREEVDGEEKKEEQEPGSRNDEASSDNADERKSR
jgi:Leucine-rich repeat (LRR) protein